MAISRRTSPLRKLAIRAAPIALVILGLARVSAAENDSPAFARVRSTDPSLSALIDRAATQSPTFQGLLTTIQRSNGMVQVENGKCRHSVWACLRMWMETVNSTRFLRIVIDRRKGDSDVDVMASLGHELQHAVEALSEPGVTDWRDLYNLFDRLGPRNGGRFETADAVHTGDAVRNELRAH
jgi:hypothetical protein